MPVEQCCKMVLGPGAWHKHRCTRKATVMKDGKGYCKQHDPGAVAKRDAERRSKRDAERERESRKWRMHNAARDLALAAIEMIREDGPGSLPEPLRVHAIAYKDDYDAG